jgi:hypothetical protein
MVHNAFYKRQRKGIFYGWMVEEGHRIGTKRTGYLKKSPHGRGSGGSGAGFVKGRPWWSLAVHATEGRALTDFVTELTKAVARMEKRTGKTPNPDALVPQ